MKERLKEVFGMLFSFLSGTIFCLFLIFGTILWFALEWFVGIPIGLVLYIPVYILTGKNIFKYITPITYDL